MCGAGGDGGQVDFETPGSAYEGSAVQPSVDAAAQAQHEHGNDDVEDRERSSRTRCGRT
jgi:hypothetical protein